MDLKQTRQSIMAAETVEPLYEIELDLVELIGTLHKGIMMADSNFEQSEVKSNLSMANALLNICKDRQADVRDTGNRLNYNFRMAAKTMLSKETYQSIMDKSFLPRKEVKMEKKELQKNRLSN